MISKSNVENIYPLTPLQEGMLFHDLKDPGKAYFQQLSFRCQGQIDPEVFRATWEELVRRHDVLRTIFVHQDVPRPLQIVLHQWPINFSAHDLRKLPKEEAEARIIAFKEEDRGNPFNPAKDPLTRVKVISLADNEAEVIWSHHHIILDGWSAGILHGELLEIYRALKLGRPHNLPQPIPFSEYMTWIGRRDQEASRRFWQKVLEGYSQTIGIPRFPQRNQEQAGHRNFNFRLDSRISQSLTTLAANNGVTLNVLLQVFWGILLCRLNGVDEAVFAATVSGRPDELKGIERMVGLFINAVPVRISLSQGGTFSELLKAHQAETLAASGHHWYSLAEIQAESFLKQALLDHILIFENFPLDERMTAGARLAEGGFDIVKVEIRENTHYPFELSIIPGNEIAFKMGYDPSVYDQAQMERVAWSLEYLIDTVIENQPVPPAGLSILSPREKELITKVFNRPKGSEADETVADVLERRAAEDPERMALVFESRQLTYGELNEAANRVAHYLQRQGGVQPDQVVGLLMDRSERMMAGLLGIIKSGAAYLPLDPAYPAARLNTMLEDSGCLILLTEGQYRQRTTGLHPEAVIIELDQLPEAPTTNPLRSTRPDNLLYLIYTSGSTGRPKGVMLEQRHVVGFNRNLSEVFGLALGDTLLALTTITFDISVLELICSLMSGLTIVLASEAQVHNPAKAAALLGQKKINVLQITPSHLQLILEEAELSILSGLKALLIGGEPLPRQLFERLKTLPDINLFNVYGPTETTIWSIAKRLNQADLTIGRPLVGEEVLILSLDGRQVLPVGVWGEIGISGQGLARGYWKQPELTRDRFPPHPWRPGERIYRSGDLGRFLPDGDIQCGGRLDQQVKVRGFRIESGEIEQTLLKIPGIREAVAHVVETDGLKEIVAYLVPDGETLPSPTELRERLAEFLPDYMLPTFYVALNSLPLTLNGKIDRQALPRPTGRASGAGLAGTGAYLPPRTATESVLAAIWQRILGVERVGVRDNFFDLGGQSIKAIRICSAIARELGREIPLSLIFQKPVLAWLASALEGTSVEHQTIFPLPPQPWYETSPGQRRLWILQQMAPESAAYNLSVALKMQGDLDTKALEKSLITLVERHEALRTIFREEDGRPVQVVLPAGGEILTTVDLRDQPTPWERALELARQQAATPFDLDKGPLFRVWLYRTGREECLLMLLMHHINGDAWSGEILLSELAERYHLQANGRTSPSALPTVQVKEWAHFQNQALASGAWERSKQYWHKALAGAGAPLNLPTDLPRPAVRPGGGKSLQVTLPGDTVARLEELGRSRGATLFMVLLTLLKTLLYRESGQDEITVGIPVAGRPLEQIEGTVGFFVNTLALRSRIRADQTFSKLLDQVRQGALEAYEHQLYPFDVLVNELSIPRDTGHAPLFEVMAVMQDKGEPISGFSHLMVSPVPLGTGTSRFDLVFNFIPSDEGLALELEYATDLFTPETAQRLAGRFRKLADSASLAPETGLKALDLLSEEEREALCSCSTGSVIPWPQEKSMVDLFRDQARRIPEAIAVVASDQTLSYAQLDQLSERCALQLQRCHALEPEEVVGMMTGQTSALPIALLGILKGGGVYLPIDPDQPEGRLGQMISDSGLKTIIVDNETGAQVVPLPGIARVIEITTLLQNGSEGAVQNHPTSSSAAYIIYTSGSTGRPKGVLLEHGGFVNMILDQIRTFGITPADRCLLFSSFSSDAAMSEIFLALHSGAGLVIAHRDQTADPERFSRLLGETGTTVATLPPAYLNALRATGASLDPLRVIITAGEAAIAADVLHYAKRKTVFNAYGPTEASVCSAIHRVENRRSYHGSIPIGRPMANSELLLLDDQQQLVPFGLSGEICLAGPGLARGYLHKPELTAAAFVAHPFKKGRRLYRTGDLGRRLADGTVEFLGREDDQVKIRGFRIECAEVERALLRHRALKGAVVVARGEGPDRELVAFLLSRGELDPGGLKAELANQLPAFMRPSRYVLLEAFPKNANGKIDRKRLASVAIGQELTVRTGEAPATTLERRLAAIWAQILGRRGFSRHDSFFDVGGHSLAALRVITAIRRELDLSLPLPALYQHASLAELARECERTASFAETYQEDQPLLLNRGGKMDLFAFPPIVGYPMAYIRLAELLAEVRFHGFSFIESDDRLERYLEWINQLQPSGPVRLLGHSSGGNLAFEMAKELERQGRTVLDLILLDSWKRLPKAPGNEIPDDWIDPYPPAPALYGNLAEWMESPHYRQIAFGKLRRYLDYTKSLTTEGIIKGTIHLLCAAERVELDGLSQEWRVHTSAACQTYQGSGSHPAMLKEPWVEENASVINGLLKRELSRC
ncbi:MAG: amino acid adenylation domain-containing protein [Pseudomonadota bacterium]